METTMMLITLLAVVFGGGFSIYTVFDTNRRYSDEYMKERDERRKIFEDKKNNM